MIVFDGQLSPECRFISGRLLNRKISYLTFCMSPIGIGFFIAGAFLLEVADVLFLLGLAFVIDLPLGIAFYFIPTMKMAEKNNERIVLEISGGRITVLRRINTKNNKENKLCSLKITRIADYGQFYVISASKQQKIVIEKTLLKEGELRDFETMFSDKLVKKIV